MAKVKVKKKSVKIQVTLSAKEAEILMMLLAHTEDCPLDGLFMGLSSLTGQLPVTTDAGWSAKNGFMRYKKY